MPFDPGVRDLLAGANFVHLATLLPRTAVPTASRSGRRPRRRPRRVLHDPTSRKARNLDGDPRLAMSLVDRDNPYRTAMLRGRLVQRIEGDEAAAIVDRISHKYTGKPFPYPPGLAFVVEVTHSRLFSLVDNFKDTPRT